MGIFSQFDILSWNERKWQNDVSNLIILHLKWALKAQLHLCLEWSAFNRRCFVFLFSLLVSFELCCKHLSYRSFSFHIYIFFLYFFLVHLEFNSRQIENTLQCISRAFPFLFVLCIFCNFFSSPFSLFSLLGSINTTTWHEVNKVNFLVTFVKLERRRHIIVLTWNALCKMKWMKQPPNFTG